MFIKLTFPISPIWKERHQERMKYSWIWLLIILSSHIIVSSSIAEDVSTLATGGSSFEAGYPTSLGQASSRHHHRHNHRAVHQRIRRHQQQLDTNNEANNDHEFDNSDSSVASVDNGNESIVLSPFTNLSVNVDDSLENLPDEFWIRVAEAKTMAVYIENEIMPRLDDWSQIMKAAACRDAKDNTKCKDFLTCAGKAAATLYKNPPETEKTSSMDKASSYMEKIWDECKVPVSASLQKATSSGIVFAPSDIPRPIPIFHCNSHIGIDDANRNFESNFRIEYPGTISPPKSISSDMIPRFFVVEKQQRGRWKIHGITPYWLFRFGIKLNETFKLRITAVSPKYVYRPIMSHPVTLYEPSHQTIGTPVNLRVVNISVDDGAARPSPSALLRWNSGSGYNGSCDFDVYYMDETSFKIERNKGDDAFWVKLNKLQFDRTYNIKVIEKFGRGRETPAVIMDLKIPSCLQLRGYSFDSCPPPPPTNIQFVNATETSFWIVWEPPKFTNATNKIRNYNVNVDWFNVPPVSDGIMQSPTIIHKVFNGNVAGDITRLQIKNGTVLPGQYRVSIVAISASGPSIAGLNYLSYKATVLNTWTVQKIIILFSVLLGVVLLVGLICLFKNVYERQQRKKKRQEKFENYEKESFQLPQIDRDAAKWEIDWCNVSLGEPIGQGNFGLVRRATLNRKGRKIVVAVKTLRDDVDDKDVGKLWEEFEILKNLDPHVHVVGLKGIVTNHGQHPRLVVEYCDGGNLQIHLREASKSNVFDRKYSPSTSANSGSSLASNSENRVQVRVVTNEAYFMREEPQIPPLTMADLLNYARQIANGMEYLSANKIVHRDLAARNILISGKPRTLKISDFGLSRDVYEQSMYKKSSKGHIPIKWLAVESLLKEIYTTESDIWSYGILLWEIFTFGGIPYPGVDTNEVFEKLKNGYRMPRPDHCPEDLYRLMRSCWEEEPCDRPEFTSIRLILEDIIEKTTQVAYLNVEPGIKSACEETYDTREPALPPRRPQLPPIPYPDQFNSIY